MLLSLLSLPNIPIRVKYSIIYSLGIQFDKVDFRFLPCRVIDDAHKMIASEDLSIIEREIICMQLSSNFTIPTETFTKLLETKSRNSKILMALNVCAPPEILAELSVDSDPIVRNNALKNESVPEYIKVMTS